MRTMALLFFAAVAFAQAGLSPTAALQVRLTSDHSEAAKIDVNGNEFRYRSFVFLDPQRQHKDPRSYDVFLQGAVR